MITLKNITKVYRNGDSQCVALDGINLELPQRGLVLIEGRSGSGKTTLLNILAGFDKATEGEVICAYDKNFCSMIFQDFQLIDMLTIRQNLELVQDIIPQAKIGIDSLTEKYELADILNKHPNEISGGQKQRVAVVRAVLENRPIILCDEPTGNLDEENAIMIADLLKNESKDKLIIVVSHDVELFKNICDRHIKLKDGHIVKDDVINKIEIKSKSEDKKRQEVLKPGIKTQCYLSYKLFRKHLVKNIFLIIALFLSFGLLISAFNGLLNLKGFVIYNVYKRQAETTIDLALQHPKYSDQLISMREEDYADIYKKHDVAARFVDANKIVFYKNSKDNCIITRFYIADKCTKKMLCGSGSTYGRTIIISDYIATRLLEYNNLTHYNELLGMTILDDYTIGGVFKTKYSILGESEKSELNDNSSYASNDSNYKQLKERQYQSAYISYDTVIDNKSSEENIYINFCNTSTHSEKALENTVYKGQPSTRVVYGEKVDLASGTIAISEGNALNYLTDNPQELIGQVISIEFSNYRSVDYNVKYNNITLEFEVAYIFAGGSAIALSEEDYCEIVSTRNSSFFGDKIWGVSIERDSKFAVQSLISKGYTDASYYADLIGECIRWTRTLTYIELTVGVVMLIISLIILCNHIAALVDKEKRTLGVLISLGLKVKHTTLMYLAGTIISVILCLFLSSIMEIFIVMAVNVMMKHISGFQAFFYEPLSVFSLFIIFALIILLVYVFLVNRLSKKQIVDIIYER